MVDGKAFDFHLLPSGIINEKCKSVIGEYNYPSFQAINTNHSTSGAVYIDLIGLLKRGKQLDATTCTVD